MNTSDERIIAIRDYVLANGKHAAIQEFNIKLSSLDRYLRTSKHIGSTKPLDFGGFKTTVPTEYLAPHKDAPKILIFDIETAPLLASVWGLWKQNVNLDLLVNDWFMLSWSAKWLHDNQVFCGIITPEEVKSENDERITRSLWQFINEADIVIAHNGKKFDVKRVNTRFLFHGLNPPLPYRVIDTLEAVKRTFAISSNRMDYINRFLHLERKMETGGAQLWVKCLKGDPDSLRLMGEYNQQDVIALEQMYLRILAWIPQHPNFNVYTKDNTPVCSNCGSTELTFEGNYYTNVSKFKSYRCTKCGHVGRGRYTELSREKRQSIVV